MSGGVGFFPSPLGRLIGLTGITGLAIFNILACLLLAIAIWKLSPKTAIFSLLIWLVVPLSWWTAEVGVDALGCALLLWSLLTTGLPRLILGSLSVLVHLAILPLVMFWFLFGKNAPALRLAAWITCLGLGVMFLELTQYNVVGHFSIPRAGILSVEAFLLALWPFLLFTGRLRKSLYWPELAAWTIGGVLAAGIIGASDSHHPQPRYLLPVVALACVSVTTTRVQICTPERTK